MARIPKVHFGQPQLLIYDVFVRLGANHFVIVGRAGSPSQIHRLKAFDSDIVPWFYILPQDYPKYVDQTVENATKAVRTIGGRVELLSAIGQSIAAVVEFTRVSGFTQKGWETTRRLSELVFDVAMARPAMVTLLAELQNLGELQTRHAMGVAMFSVLVARELGASNEALKNLAAAALVHDIGFLRLPEDLVHKREELLTPEERKQFETHPLLGATILKDCTQVPSEVVTLVLEHHENAIGTGYPRKLKAEQMQKQSMVLALCERFCELTIGDTLHWEFLTPQAAINTITNVEGHPYPTDIMKVLDRHLRRVPVKTN